MKHLQQVLYIFLVFFLFPLAAQTKGGNYTAHEWGTFTSLLGSDGRTQNGMYHEDEPLPNFVHGFGELVNQPVFRPDPGNNCRNRKIPCEFLERNIVTQKMETPVIYFYNKSNSVLNVNVDVRFPEGAVSETFPGPTFTTPTRNSAPVLSNGHTIFNVKVYPLGVVPSDARLPYVDPANIYSHARNVDSSLVRTNDEMERFIFYRGAGRFQPDIEVTSAYGGLRIHPTNNGDGVPPMILVDVGQDGSVRALDLSQFATPLDTIVDSHAIDALRDHQGPKRPARINVLDRKEAFERIRSMLTEAGLTSPEAQAMVNTWEHGYLSVPGLRLLYILPAREVERVLPLRLEPAPAELTRVFVGRLEVMLDTDEKALMRKIIAAGDLIDVKQLGRFAESMLRRTLEVYYNSTAHAEPNPKIVELFQRLIERAKSQVI